MNRTLIKLGPISIYWYSVMIAVGFLAAMVVCLTEVKRKKLDIEKYSNMVFYAVLFGILGARIYYVLFNLDYFNSKFFVYFDRQCFSFCVNECHLSCINIKRADMF